MTEQATVPCTHLHSPPDGGPTPNARLGIWEVISQRGAWGPQPDGHTATDGDLLLPSAHRPGELVRLPVGTLLACEAVVGLIAVWSKLGEETRTLRAVMSEWPARGASIGFD
jgi:hypothetical protein